ncbi:MAG: LysM peptidoglycan-binding domain-containing protein [Nevskia sp.]|nr:LysM peptidoglycan-binding domain-containing protein [Nevskia sp.]
MGKYNASTEQLGLAGLTKTAGAVAALLLALAAGCADQPADGQSESTAPAAAPAPAAMPPEPSPSDSVSPVDNIDQATAAAGDLSLRQDAPLHYTVRKGDTLWGISNHFLRDAWQWPQLWYDNGQIKNPHLIYPGEVLTLVMVNGRPRVVRSEDRLHPGVHELPLDQAIPAIPIDAIREFLRGPRLISKEEIERAPYVVEFTDEHVIAGQNSGVFVKNLPHNDANSWSLVKVGQPYIDPDSHELLGYEAIPTGEADLRDFDKEVAEMMLTRSPQEVEIGNRLLPLEPESFKADFYPHPPATPVDGRILSVYNGLSQITQYAIVALNRGSRDGLDPGTVLGIYQQSRQVSDPYGSGKVALPEQKAGLLMVFKVTPRISYGLVMTETRAAHVLDKVRNPRSTAR